MKKTLLLMAAAVMTATSVSADIITLETKNATDIIGTENNGNIIDMTSCKIGDYSFTFKTGAEATASQTPRWWAADQTIRIYKGAQMTITAPVQMNGIVFSAKAAANCKNFDTASADQGTVTVASPDVTWVAATAANTMTLTLPGDVNANFQIQTIKIYTGADKPGSGTVEPPVVSRATTVAELLSVANGSEFTFEGELVVAYANGPDCYVYDRTGATLLYSSKSDPWAEVLAPGTIITEFSGKRDDYNTTVEFIPTMNSLVTEGETDVEAVACSNAAAVEAAAVDTYVKLVNVNFTLDAENDRYALATFEDGTSIKIYNRFNGNSYDPKTAYPAAGKYDIYGLRSVFNGEAQVNFTSDAKASVGVDTITAEQGETVVYDLQGRRVQGQPAAGLYIIVENGNARKVVIK